MEEQLSGPSHAALRRFRVSQPEAVYFITANVERRAGLAAPWLVNEIHAEWLRLEQAAVWTVMTAVIMPDHVHLLIQLGRRLSLSDSMRLFRGRLAPKLRAHALNWQKAFYEHRIRSRDDIVPVLFYIYLNPYQAGLLPRNQVWAGYFCRAEEWSWFSGLTADAVPQPEWLR